MCWIRITLLAQGDPDLAGNNRDQGKTLQTRRVQNCANPAILCEERSTAVDHRAFRLMHMQESQSTPEPQRVPASEVTHEVLTAYPTWPSGHLSQSTTSSFEFNNESQSHTGVSSQESPPSSSHSSKPIGRPFTPPPHGNPVSINHGIQSTPPSATASSPTRGSKRTASGYVKGEDSEATAAPNTQSSAQRYSGESPRRATQVRCPQSTLSCVYILTAQIVGRSVEGTSGLCGMEGAEWFGTPPAW